MRTRESLKLINSFVYSFLVAFSFLEYLFVLPIVVVLFFEKEHFMKILKKIVLLNFFIVFLVLFVYFQNQKEALEIFIRTNFILIFNVTLFYSSQGYDIARGLDALGFSSKVVSVLYFSLSLIHYLRNDFLETKNTLKSRGFKSSTSMFTYQTYGNIFAMIFIKALKKSDDMKVSITARGFNDKIFFLNSDCITIFEKLLSASIVIILAKVIYELFC